MKNSIFFILPFLFLFISNTPAQQLSPFVVSSSGGFYSNSSGMLSFTTGEMSAVETYKSPFAILTQGFQQSWDFGTYITEHPNPNFSYGIYPNPSDGNFYLLTKATDNNDIAVKIVDVSGREILTKRFYQQDKINVIPFDLSDKAQGTYLFVFTLKENSTKQEYHGIQKIQIVQ